ncbi:hypothetical protein VD0001_g6703 [Verticillium dahliae]|nr:hypothetical protein VD0001_g6703 [Verticillium dahliae]
MDVNEDSLETAAGRTAPVVLAVHQMPDLC